MKRISVKKRQDKGIQSYAAFIGTQAFLGTMIRKVQQTFNLDPEKVREALDNLSTTDLLEYTKENGILEESDTLESEDFKDALMELQDKLKTQMEVEMGISRPKAKGFG